MRTKMIDEPTTSASVDMLRGLPAEEANYYGDEENLVRPGAASETLFEEISEKFSFVGGTQEEYEEYFQLPETDRLWGFALPEEVKATAGFSCVATKPRADGTACCANS